MINKSDLISDYVREKWSAFFNKQGIDHVFFSAKQQQEEIDTGVEEQAQDDFLDYRNTPKIVKRGSLINLLKTLVIKYRQLFKASLGEVITEAKEIEEEDNNKDESKAQT